MLRLLLKADCVAALVVRGWGSYAGSTVVRRRQAISGLAGPQFCEMQRLSACSADEHDRRAGLSTAEREQLPTQASATYVGGVKHWDDEEDRDRAYQLSPDATAMLHAGASRVNQLASRFNRRVSFEVLLLKSDGSQKTVTVTRRQLLSQTGLRPRDLRRIDPSMAMYETSPNILVRRNVWLISIHSVRAVIAEGCALFFDHNSPATTSALETLTRRLAYSQQETRVQFELEVVESALMAAQIELDNQLNKVAPQVTKLLNELPVLLSPGGIERLRAAKQALVEIGTRADSIRMMLLELLEEEGDIKKMAQAAATFQRPGRARWLFEDGSDNGSLQEELKKRHSKSQHDAAEPSGSHNGTQVATAPVLLNDAMAAAAEEEVELLLEYYLERAVSVHMECEKLLAVARDMETSISVHLSSRRYEVNRLELLLTVGAFAVGIGAMIAGIFGMNLQSRLELHAWAFWYTTAGIVVGCTMLFWMIIRYIKKRAIL
eukprot:jgi/Chlat1/7427/Chrsp6S07448